MNLKAQQSSKMPSFLPLRLEHWPCSSKLFMLFVKYSKVHWARWVCEIFGHRPSGLGRCPRRCHDMSWYFMIFQHRLKMMVVECGRYVVVISQLAIDDETQQISTGWDCAPRHPDRWEAETAGSLRLIAGSHWSQKSLQQDQNVIQCHIMSRDHIYIILYHIYGELRFPRDSTRFELQHWPHDAFGIMTFWLPWNWHELTGNFSPVPNSKDGILRLTWGSWKVSTGSTKNERQTILASMCPHFSGHPDKSEKIEFSFLPHCNHDHGWFGVLLRHVEYFRQQQLPIKCLETTPRSSFRPPLKRKQTPLQSAQSAVLAVAFGTMHRPRCRMAGTLIHPQKDNPIHSNDRHGMADLAMNCEDFTGSKCVDRLLATLHIFLATSNCSERFRISGHHKTLSLRIASTFFWCGNPGIVNRIASAWAFGNRNSR